MTGIQYVFSEETSQGVEKHLAAYLKASRSRCVLLLAKSGHLISQAGFSGTFNVQSISALIGGIFSSTQALARLVGEEKFTVMFLEGRGWNVYFILVSDHFILANLFDKSTVVGMVRNAAVEAGARLEPLLAGSVVSDFAPAGQDGEEPGEPGSPQDLSPLREEPAMPDFNQAVEDALSKLFS
jgi:predicted regulator of Ras-like GTPase activity (Roadblock/LC7/MglB family)